LVKFDKVLAEQVVRKLTGDRLSLIVNVSKWSGESFAGIRQRRERKRSDLHADIRNHTFDEIKRYANKLLDGQLTRAPAGHIIAALLKSHSESISYDDFRNIVVATAKNSDWESVINSLRTSQIFLVTEDSVSFHSLAVQAYFQERKQ
jgi:hypothetical protein